MSKNKKLIVGIIAAIALLATLLVGCGDSKANDKLGEDEKVKKDKEVANEDSDVSDEQKQEKKDGKKPKVIVAINPMLEIAREIGKDKIELGVMIPPGASPANYELKPQDMKNLEDADLYFGIGVPADMNNIRPVLDNMNVKLIALEKIVAEKYEDRFFGAGEHHHHDDEDDEHGEEHHHDDEDDEHGEEHHHDDEDDEHDEEHHHDGGRDPHIWLSTKRIAAMAEAIKAELSKVDPDNQAFYAANLDSYLDRVEGAQDYVKKILGGVENRTFLIYHPALGYFADDFGLKMLTIEEDGKEASAASLKKVIDAAKEEKVGAVFYQKEFSDAQAKTIADELGIKLIELKVLSENLLDTLTDMADKLAE